MPYRIIEGKIEQQHFSTDDVMDKLEKDDIKFIDLQFTGLYGKFHHITISANMFKKTDFENGLPKVDGSSIRGFTEIHESDLIVRPDPSTYAIIPWIENTKHAG